MENPLGDGRHLGDDHLGARDQREHLLFAAARLVHLSDIAEWLDRPRQLDRLSNQFEPGAELLAERIDQEAVQDEPVADDED